MRFDLYTNIHKAQRHHFLPLAGEIGRTDFADPPSAHRIEGAMRQTLDHLRDHARNEETYIHPLFHALGDSAVPIEEDHHELETELAQLESIVSERRWSELYARYASFLGRYLAHLDAEERLQAEVLWPNYDDRELAAVFQRFQTERPPANARSDFQFLLPALSIPELTAIFRRMRTAAPEAFPGACELAAQTLDAERWSQLERTLATG